MADHDAIPTHITRVAGVERIGSMFVRVTFSGGLERYEPKGPDDFVYVLLPPPGRRELTIDESFRWTAYYEMSDDERPVGAYYSVRHWRPETREIVCDVFLHEPAGSVSGWAPAASLGDPVAMWGPRTAWTPPADTTSYLLLADETVIPAMRAILDQRPPGLTATCVIEVDDRDAHEPLSTIDSDVSVRVVARDAHEAGTTSLLLDAVCALDLEATAYVWGGAESRAMATIRRHVRHERGMPKERVSLTPYWRHPAHADDPAEDDD